MNHATIKFLICAYLITEFGYSSENTRHSNNYNDDIKKQLDKLNLNGSQPISLLMQLHSYTREQRPDVSISYVEKSHDYDETTFHYNNGDYTKISFVGPQGMCEMYDHRTGRTTRENF